MKRPLSTDELEVVGKALRLTVRHRGGGPFGVGRLAGSEAVELESALLEVSELLKKDSQEAVPVKIATTSPGGRREPTALPPLPLSKSSSVNDVAVKNINNKQVEKITVSEKKQKPVPSIPPPPVATPPAPVTGSVPISLGLDQFLQNPQQLQTQVRNDMIDLLY